jgi:phosphoribosylformylglycinamidine (FGAM) synthase PurS component
MNHYVHVFAEHADDPGLAAAVRLLGYPGIRTVCRSRIYEIGGAVTRAEAERLCLELLADPVSDRFTVNRRIVPRGAVALNIWYKPGVLDVVAQAVLKAAGYMGMTGSLSVRSGGRVDISPDPGRRAVERIARLALMNELIQYYETI